MAITPSGTPTLTAPDLPATPSTSAVVTVDAPRAPSVDVSAQVPAIPLRASSPSLASPEAKPDTSTLAAEIAALGAARAQLAASPDEARVSLARYRRAFPRGKLGPEADVIALEALAAKGDRPRLVREATLFLRRYPHAPHRTRVKQLVDEAGR